VQAVAPRSIPTQYAKVLSDAGLEIQLGETMNSRTTSGGHNILRTIADKTLVRGLSSVNLPPKIIDVGSKFTTMDKLLNLYEHFGITW